LAHGACGAGADAEPAGKTPVIGLLKRGGKVFTGMVKNCSRADLGPIIKGQLLSQTTVYTDGWLAYDGLLLSGYKHRRIHHHENEFARGKNHVNGIESFWSYAKFASSSCVAFVRSSSFSISRNRNGGAASGIRGREIIDSIIYSLAQKPPPKT
jgi:transposase-like protein